MTNFLYRFSLDAIKWDYQIAACVALLWLMVVFCALSSVASQKYGVVQRWFWVGMILLLPGVGLLIYLPFAFRSTNYFEWFIFRGLRRPKAG